MSDEKIFISAEELLRDSFLLANKILESGFRPDYIVGIWRGGTPVGIAVQEFLDYAGVEPDHIAIRTSHYTGIAQATPSVQVHGLGYLIRKVNRQDALLIVDDVFDTGNKVKAVISEIKQQARGNTPEDIRIAVPWFKPSRNETDIKPHFYLRETSAWLVFPHELDALNPKEMREFRPALHEIIHDVSFERDATKSDESV